MVSEKENKYYMVEVGNQGTFPHHRVFYEFPTGKAEEMLSAVKSELNDMMPCEVRSQEITQQEYIISTNFQREFKQTRTINEKLG